MKNNNSFDFDFKKLSLQMVDQFGNHLKEKVEKSIHEAERIIQPSFVYNTDADLVDFNFLSYKPDYEAHKISLAAVSAGDEISTSIEFYQKKGDDFTAEILQKCADSYLIKLADFINFQICRDIDEDLKQGYRKFPGTDNVNAIENKKITHYLNSDKINISSNDAGDLFPVFTKVFFVEWVLRTFKHNDFKKRCQGCSFENCKFRI